MFTRNEVKQNLIGCFEIMLFMKQGVKRFSDSKSSAIKSFVLPLLLIPLSLIISAYEITGFTIPMLVVVMGGTIIVTTALTMGAVYLLAKQYDKHKFFFKYLNITNWMSVPIAIFILPMIIALVTEFSMWVDWQAYGAFVVISFVIFNAFILTHVLKIPWELGGFLAIVGMSIGQSGLDIVILIRDSMI